MYTTLPPVARKAAIGAEGDLKNRVAGGNKHKRPEHVLSAIIKLHYGNFREK